MVRNDKIRTVPAVDDGGDVWVTRPTNGPHVVQHGEHSSGTVGYSKVRPADVVEVLNSTCDISLALCGGEGRPVKGEEVEGRAHQGKGKVYGERGRDTGMMGGGHTSRACMPHVRKYGPITLPHYKEYLYMPSHCHCLILELGM